MAHGSTIKHRDELERMEGSGECTWLLARKAQSTTAPILRDAVPPQLILALHQHGGHSAKPISARSVRAPVFHGGRGPSS